LSSASLGPALAALAGGRPVRVGGLTVASVETASDEFLTSLGESAIAQFLVTNERAAALGLGNRLETAAGDPVAIARDPWMDAPNVRAIVDPALDFARVAVGPMRPFAPTDPAEAGAALRLARIAGVLPALWVLPDHDDSVGVALDDINATSHADIVARARLPIDSVGIVQIVVFREMPTGAENVALLLGEWGSAPPLVRLHSECLTGDVFASLKCDCGPQLHAALKLIADAGGILLYLRQEGRGIGLANKIRAYALQDRGLDTVEANRRLGFTDDARDYAAAASMLSALKVDSVRLLTNNPTKVAGLEAAGIAVTERVSHHLPTNPHNEDYIATKKARSGHFD
jgi:GTP cyclohydrolase II